MSDAPRSAHPVRRLASPVRDTPATAGAWRCARGQASVLLIGGLVGVLIATVIAGAVSKAVGREAAAQRAAGRLSAESG